MKDFSKMERNFEGVQFAELRKTVDVPFNVVHDELSDCYYNKKPFRTYGILDKATFDKLHGLIFLQREVKFHEENLKLSAGEKIPESKYNDILDKDGAVIGKANEKAVQDVATLKAEGIELTI